uniref:Uncharacterized protein n=1 Tax=Arundo donax TaxID=35708 RepID=A0A0A9C1M9_ARUDO
MEQELQCEATVRTCLYNCTIHFLMANYPAKSNRLI